MYGAGNKHQHSQAAGSAPRAGKRQKGRSLDFPRMTRLRKHADFERVYQQGRRLFSGNMTVFYRPRTDREQNQGPRIGFTVSRAFGGAVERNRLKRRLREAVRLNLSFLQGSVDVVIHPKKSASGAEFAELSREVQRGFAQLQRRLASSAATGTAECRGGSAL